jgi:thiosulfate reductase cytochrome b subunit
MINTWGPNLNYTPEIWPFWLKIAAVLVIATLLGILGHALLRMIFGKAHADGKEHKSYLYILPVRLWHWCNALFFIVLLVTGLVNHFSMPSESLVYLHNLLGKIYVLVWIAFIFIGLLTGNIKHYVMEVCGLFGRVMKQVQYYMFGILQGKPHPFEVNAENKFNPIQQVSYVGVMFVMVPAIIISGLVALYVKAPCALTLHFALGVLGLIFMLVHVYMCTTGNKPLDLIKSMIDGYHRDKE